MQQALYGDNHASGGNGRMEKKIRETPSKPRFPPNNNCKDTNLMQSATSQAAFHPTPRPCHAMPRTKTLGKSKRPGRCGNMRDDKPK